TECRRHAQAVLLLEMAPDPDEKIDQKYVLHLKVLLLSPVRKFAAGEVAAEAPVLFRDILDNHVDACFTAARDLNHRIGDPAHQPLLGLCIAPFKHLNPNNRHFRSFPAFRQYYALSARFQSPAVQSRAARGQGCEIPRGLSARQWPARPPETAAARGRKIRRSEERRVGKECGSRWSPPL